MDALKAGVTGFFMGLGAVLAYVLTHRLGLV
jgi:hypothetical protein